MKDRHRASLSNKVTASLQQSNERKHGGAGLAEIEKPRSALGRGDAGLTDGRSEQGSYLLCT